jgi:predicted Zn-dependent protease
VLGAAAAVASGDSRAAGAGLLGGSALAQQSMLQYSVTQESAADQAGLTFLDRTGQSARGLYEFFKILQDQDLLAPQRQDPYLRTHPLTRQRMDTVGEHVRTSKYSNVPDPPEFVELHKRMRAKLAAFLNPPGQTLSQYKESDPSVAARYARAIAYYRQPDLAKAVPLIDQLIREEPKNPYFHELKGQMLFENGKVREALPSYEESVRIAPDQPLLRVELAQAQVESGDAELNKRALAHLNEALRTEDQNPTAWHFLAIAYGRQENFGMASLALAEEAMVKNDKAAAQQQATRALQLLPKGSPGRLRAEDIREEAKRLKDSP